MEYVLVNVKDNIATLTLNRPDKRNAMNGKMIMELLQALQTILHDENAHVLLIQGAGEHFCAGADIAWMQKVASGSTEENSEDAELLADLMLQLYRFKKPTIALAQGATMGGGLGILAACDIAIAAHHAVFAFSEVKIGITPSVISPYVITAIGERAAHYYFLTGEKFAATDALRLGLVNQVHERDALMNAGLTIAKTLLQNNRTALGEAKKLIRMVAKQAINETLAEKTAAHLATLRASKEAEACLKRFFETRAE
jgi:methylglutaconyl-CoA hydratase